MVVPLVTVAVRRLHLQPPHGPIAVLHHVYVVSNVDRGDRDIVTAVKEFRHGSIVPGHPEMCPLLQDADSTANEGLDPDP